MKVALVRYGEISLKSPRSRSKYEDKLIENIEKCLNAKNIAFDEIRKERGRIFVSGSDVNIISKTISNIFGVISSSPAEVVDSNLDIIKETAYNIAKEKLHDGMSFGVSARRTKDQSISSQDVNKDVGQFLLEKIDGISVNLDNPDYKLYVEVRSDYTYIFDEIFKGSGGLPVGTQGKAIALISGNVDSILSMYLIMKRGCAVIPVFFEAPDFFDNIGRDVILEVLRGIFEYEYGEDRFGYVIDFNPIIRTIESKIDIILRCILCKRTMFRIAEQIARKKDAHAICVGENIGKQMKFALANLKMVDLAVNVPILRPLVGMDSNEVDELAKKVLPNVSILKKQICGLSTKTEIYKDLWKLETTEEDADLDLFINQAVSKREKFEF